MKKMLLVLAFIVFSVQNLNAELISRVLGDCPNFSQTSNGNFLAVVSRDYGRGAKAGALVEFFYPLYARDHLWDAYNGIYMNGRLSWLHDLRLVGQSMPDDTGIVTSEFCTADGKLSIVTSDVALRDSDTLVRHLEITNNSKERVDDLRVFFYEHFTVNYLGSGDVVRFDQKSRTILHGGKDVHFTIGSDIPADQWQIGKVGSTWITNHDARLDAEDGGLRGHMHERGMLDMGVNGALGHTFRGLKPGERLAINYFISAGRSLDESWKSFHLAKSRLWNEILTSEAGFWNGWLGKAKELVGADERTRRVYRRALITLKQNTADNGAIIAAPTLLSPVYCLTWPRDGSFISLAYLEAGFPEEAGRFIDFILAQQKGNGGWAVNFFMDGSRHLWDFGDRKNEHDQVGMAIWIVYEYYVRVRDLDWLKAKWPAVEKAAGFLLRNMTPGGLVGPCRDLWELDTDKTWTFTNGAVFAGLKAAAEIAGLVGENDSKVRFMNAAETVRQAIREQLWSQKSGAFVRGRNVESGEADTTLEAANLCLGFPFDVLSYGDKRLAMTAERVSAALATPLGGIRRYQNDPYYGGKPWPVTTDWLAIHYARSGDLERARKLHRTVTDYAFETGSLLLGEQFDEERHLWLSALPLTWSEAKYVLASLDLYGAK